MNTNNRHRRTPAPPHHAAATAAALALAATALAQTGGPFDLSWNTYDNGGIIRSTGGNFTLSGTIGQPADAAEPITGGAFTLRGGFWPGAEDATPGCPGDTDNNNTIDLNDLLTVLSNFGNAVAGGPADGDVDPPGAPNGTVDLNDLLLVLSNFGNNCP